MVPITAETFDVETDLLGISIQILWGQRVLVAVSQSSAIRCGVLRGDDRDRDHNASILGLWHVKYVNSDGSALFDWFKFWHPDGTEWEMSKLSPVVGNICVGVWRETRRGTVRLHHVSWNYDNSGTLIGTLTIDEMNIVAPDGQTYTGTHTLTIFDLDATLCSRLLGRRRLNASL